MPEDRQGAHQNIPAQAASICPFPPLKFFIDMKMTCGIIPAIFLFLYKIIFYHQISINFFDISLLHFDTVTNFNEIVIIFKHKMSDIRKMRNIKLTREGIRGGHLETISVFFDIIILYSDIDAACNGKSSYL